MVRLLIFDFDGTVADTKALYYRAIGDELRVLGFRESQIDVAIDVGMSLRKTLKRIGLNSLILWWTHKRIVKRVKKYVNDVKKCHDADKIKEIKGRKIIVTNSLKEFAVPILKHLKLKREFSRIYGADDFSDKAEFISEYIKKKKLKKKEVFYIGDRVADVKLAKKVGCVSIAVSGKCAWNSRKEVLKAEPDFIVDDLIDIKNITD